MMKYIFIIILFFSTASLFTQPLYWQRTYTYQINTGEYGNDIVNSDTNNYFVLNTTFINGVAKLYVLKINTYGQVIWTRILDDSNYVVGNAICSENNGGCFIIASRFSQIYLFKIDKHGEVKLRKLLPIYAKINKVLRISSNEYLCMGYQDNSGYVLKLDSVGTVHDEYLLSKYSIAEFTNGIVSNNKIFLTGFIRDTSFNFKSILLTIEGNNYSEKLLTIPGYQTHGIGISKKDTKIYLLGQVRSSIAKNFILVLDSTYNGLDTIIFSPSFAHSNLSCNDAIGFNNNFLFVNHLMPGFKANLVLVDSNYNIKSEKIYAGTNYAEITRTFTHNNAIFSIGIIENINNNEDILLIKTDSNLNSIPVSIKSNNSAISNEFKVNTYPNPFNSSFIVNLELPLQENYFIKIYNILGELIYDNEFINTTQRRSLFINSSNWASGVYHLIIHNNKQILSSNKINLIK